MDEQQNRQALVTQLGIGDFSPEDQDKIIAQFGDVAIKAATIAVLEKMPQDKQEEFATLAEAGNAENIKAFLDEQVPEHEKIAADAVLAEVANFRVALAEEDMAREDSEASDNA